MAKHIDIVFPDLGGAQDVTVIEILVSEGAEISVDQPLLTLEGDKATMEVPSPFSGVIEKLSVKVGDVINEGDLIGKLLQQEEDVPTVSEESKLSDSQQNLSTAPVLTEIKLPDLGGAQDVTVIEMLVSLGDVIKKDQPLLTLEGDKATMEVPAPCSGKISELLLKVGSVVNEGDLVARVETTEITNQEEDKLEELSSSQPDTQEITNYIEDANVTENIDDSGALIYAGPSVRRLAFDLGVDLSLVKPTGPKGRLLREDLQNFVKRAMQQQGSHAAIPKLPEVDFSKFGPTTTKEISKIKKLTGEFLTRNWLNIPHVTQHGYIDITELEQLRQKHKSDFVAKGSRLTLIVFVMRALVESLQKFPAFNSSLSSDGTSLIEKSYYNIGFAVDTPQGLVVPVIKKAEQKDILQLSQEVVNLSNIARSDSGLKPGDMQGGCMTISSLGGIGGEFFTPIVNAPEVAILGLSKSSMQPVYMDNSFVPRLMLPVSLSYDHRVIDGAEGARFLMYFSEKLRAQVSSLD
ncbi:MAG: dihydrolipoyllysine-residue acetyltransferase [Pseudomonadota bacterium]|nr:dihydrolipoyllysine-residue acetyltransferase [Pseudomonadota bacterium]